MLSAANTYSATGPSRAPWLADSGTRNERPAPIRNIAISGNVCAKSISHAVTSPTRIPMTYDEAQCTPALGIDQEQCRNGEDDLNGTITQ